MLNYTTRESHRRYEKYSVILVVLVRIIIMIITTGLFLFISITTSLFRRRLNCKLRGRVPNYTTPGSHLRYILCFALHLLLLFESTRGVTSISIVERTELQAG